jgi:hypothetical protein
LFDALGKHFGRTVAVQNGRTKTETFKGPRPENDSIPKSEFGFIGERTGVMNQIKEATGVVDAPIVPGCQSEG